MPSSNFLRVELDTMDAMSKNYRELLIRNIKRRMAGKYSSPEDLAKVCRWQSGKKQGMNVSPRMVRYVFEEGSDKPLPSIDIIAAIAIALKCDIWELYFDESTMREKLIARLFEREGHRAVETQQFPEAAPLNFGRRAGDSMKQPPQP